MQNTGKKLLSITNLKKYFPIAKASVFQKERFYVRANEDVSLDIYEGETFGLVGESGCGKSTLGRVILQLYEQTAGNTFYYGRSRAEVAPIYVKKILSAPEKYLKKYKEARAKAEKSEAQIRALGESASFQQLQEDNLLRAIADSALTDAAKILGGLIAVPARLKEGAEILLRQHYALVKTEKINAKILALDAAIDFYRVRHEEILKKTGEKNKARKLNAAVTRKTAKKAELVAVKEKLAETIDAAQAEIDALRAEFKENEEFAAYEKLLDSGIDLSKLRYNEIRRLRKDIQICLSGSVFFSRSAYDDRADDRRACHTQIFQARLRKNERIHSENHERLRLAGLYAAPLSASIFGRTAAKSLHRAGAGGKAEIRSVRRVRFRARRFDTVADHQSFAGAERAGKTHVSVRFARFIRRQVYFRSDRRDVSRQHRGAGKCRNDF